MGFADEPVTLHALSGGVSCDVWRVDLPGGPICVKQALPKLRVSADWRAPPERSQAEAAWLRLAATVDPALAPAVLGEDRERHVFAMQFFPAQEYPLWKALLAEGKIDADFAARVGDAIARVHATTAGKAEVAARFDNGEQFHALRLEPYLLYTAQRHPDVALVINGLANSVATARIALMHGDVSPKNILRGPHGPVFLDAETACYGDPAFDLAFCLNHLLLKCVWHPEHCDRYLQSFASLKDAYLRGVTWETAETIEQRTAALLPALLLARIDGKSPVESITRETDKAFVRGFARAHILAPTKTLRQLADEWGRAAYFADATSR